MDIEDERSELRHCFRLRSVIARRVHLFRDGRTLRGACPRHPDRTLSLYVNEEKGIYFCFSCQDGGDVLKWIMTVENMEEAAAVEWLERHEAAPDVKLQI